MRWNIPAGVLMGLALLLPAAPAVAQAGSPGLDEHCQTVERKVYADIREFVTIDLDTASVLEVRLLAARILAEATTNSLTYLTGAIQEGLNGTAEDLRAFLKTNLRAAWSLDLRIAVARTLTGAAANVRAAAQEVLLDGTIDTYLAYLKNGLYEARARDCASAPPSASASSSLPTAASAPASPVSASVSGPSSAAAAGSLPTTGASTSYLALGGVALILFGSGIALVTRRFRT